MWLLKGNNHATSDVMTQQWNKNAHLTNDAKRNFSWSKNGYATIWDALTPLQIPMKAFLYEIMITIQLRKPNASTISMKMHHAQTCKIKNIFVFL